MRASVCKTLNKCTLVYKYFSLVVIHSWFMLLSKCPVDISKRSDGQYRMSTCTFPTSCLSQQLPPEPLPLQPSGRGKLCSLLSGFCSCPGENWDTFPHPQLFTRTVNDGKEKNYKIQWRQCCVTAFYQWKWDEFL